MEFFLTVKSSKGTKYGLVMVLKRATKCDLPIIAEREKKKVNSCGENLY